MSSTLEEHNLWTSAIDDEVDSLDSKCAWVRYDNPKSQPLPSHTILKVKRESDGTIERFKARVVAGGNHQVYGEDLNATYAPVVSFSLVRMFLYIALCLKLHISQVDVETAFLTGVSSVKTFGLCRRMEFQGESRNVIVFSKPCMD